MKKCVNVAKVKRCRIRRQGLESYKSTSPRSVSRAKGSFASNPTNRHQHYAFGWLAKHGVCVRENLVAAEKSETYLGAERPPLE